LAHWCGKEGLINGAEEKCGGKKSNEKYFKTFCANKGNDADLKKALDSLLAAHKRLLPFVLLKF